jgi:hypothetical protein
VKGNCVSTVWDGFLWLPCYWWALIHLGLWLWAFTMVAQWLFHFSSSWVHFPVCKWRLIELTDYMYLDQFCLAKRQKARINWPVSSFIKLNSVLTSLPLVKMCHQIWSQTGDQKEVKASFDQ